MITYELCLMYRVMPKSELFSSIKRTAEVIFNKGGIIRKLENLGTRQMPYRTSAHGVVHRQASYFLFELNVPPNSIESLMDEYLRDVDIIKPNLYKKQTINQFECDLHKDMKPAPYRKGVQELMNQARKFDKPKFNYNTGLDYYPFQK